MDILTVICVIIVFLCGLVIVLYIHTSRTDFLHMQTISIDGGHISKKKDHIIEINHPKIYGLITNVCFFPIILLFIIFGWFLHDIPLTRLSNHATSFLIFSLCLLVLALAILGIIRVINKPYYYSRIVFNGISKEVVLGSSEVTAIPYSHIQGFLQQSYPVMHRNFIRVIIYLKSSDDPTFDLLSITGSRGPATAKANYIISFFEDAVGLTK